MSRFFIESVKMPILTEADMEMQRSDYQNPYPPVLVFAGLDPSGGAGLLADTLTLASMGCHPLGVATAITVQDTARVDEIQAIDADLVNDQARFILEDMEVAAFKIGILGSVENIAVIAEILSDYPHIPVVLDPILASGFGDELATDEMASALREMLIPAATIITPNSVEARRLLDDDDTDEWTLEQIAEALRQLGPEYVLITGTHENTPSVINTLYGRGGRMRADSWARLPGSYHGSGCTLASAIAAYLAAGMEMPDAVREAQEYTWQSLAAGFRPGMGQFIPDRLFWARADIEAASANEPLPVDDER